VLSRIFILKRRKQRQIVVKVVEEANIPFMITHYGGHMFITDRLSDELAVTYHAGGNQRSSRLS